MSFSCLISCYKNDKVEQLEECLKSLFNQTLIANEIIIVKDGPLTDELNRALDYYSEQLPLKFLAFDKNHGLGYALNRGLLMCENEIVMRMDTDDICLSNRFELQYNYLNQHSDVDILGGWAYDINESGEIIGERKYPSESNKIYKLMWTNPLIHPTIAFRKSSIIKIGSYNPNIVRRQDYELWIRAAEKGLKIENLPEFLIKYRFTSNYYKKNNFKVVYSQALMGFDGAKRLKLPLYTKLAVFVPVVRALLPTWIIRPVHRFMTKFDPRKGR